MNRKKKKKKKKKIGSRLSTTFSEHRLWNGQEFHNYSKLNSFDTTVYLLCQKRKRQLD